MSSDDNFFDYIKSSKSIFIDDLITHKNLSSNKDIKSNNIPQESYYCLRGNSPKKENEKFSLIKDELECEKEKNIDDFLTKDIINSINEINSEFNNNLSKNESIKEKLIQNETESYEDVGNNIKNNVSEIGKEIKSEVNLNINESSDFPIKNSLTRINEDEYINHENKYLNSNININNENKTNSWNFNISPSKIFNKDNQKSQQNNNEINYVNENNVHIKNDVNSEENNHLKFNIFKSQYNNINFDNKTNNIQSQNDYIKNNFINNNNKILNNFFEQKDLNVNQFYKTNENESKKDIKDNKLNINSINLKEGLHEINKEHSNIFNNNNNFNLHMNNNNFIYCNNYINIINPIHLNKSINYDSHDTTNNINVISFGKGQDNLNLNKESYLIKMFGRLGWICRICNNFNFKSRNICNRCQTIKAPKTKEEIKQNKEINQKIKKKIKEEKIREEKKREEKIKEKKADKLNWFCPKCQNINYYFRKFCNKCKIKRKKEFPSVYLEPNEK